MIIVLRDWVIISTVIEEEATRNDHKAFFLCIVQDSLNNDIQSSGKCQ